MATSRQCKRALDLHELELSSLEAVVGLGVVPTLEKAHIGGDKDMAIGVYISKKRGKKENRLEKKIPNKLLIPGRQGEVEVPIRVIEAGEIVAETGFHKI